MGIELAELKEDKFLTHKFYVAKGRRGRKQGELKFILVGCEKWGSIERIWVSGEFRKRGIGSALLKRVTEDHPGISFSLRAGPYKWPLLSEKDFAIRYEKLLHWYEARGFRRYRRKSDGLWYMLKGDVPKSEGFDILTWGDEAKQINLPIGIL